MKSTHSRKHRLKVLQLAMALMLVIGMGTGAWAEGTPAGTEITNTATINFSVAGAPQDPLSAGTSFVVDNVVALTMTGPELLNVTPNATTALQPFTITNAGNETQGYRVVIEVPAGDFFEMSAVRIYLDEARTQLYYTFDPDTGGTYAGQQRAGDIAPDMSMTLWIEADTPSNASNAQQAIYHIVATTLDAGTETDTVQTEGQWDADDVQVVFADGAGSADGMYDGQYSIAVTYRVSSAALTVTKTATVIEDELESDNPKAIPGAIVRYTITITNNGSEAAQDVTVTDSIPENTTYVDGSISVGTIVDGDINVEFASIEPDATVTVTFDVKID